MQLIEYCQNIFSAEGIDISLRPYQIICTGNMAGLVEFLEGAKSYDDKLTLVKILSEKEKSRVVLLFKKMIQSGMEEANRKKGLK